MILTTAQITAFFEDADQMTIPHATILQLQVKGIVSPDGLAEFDDASLKQITENLCHPSWQIPDQDPNAAPGGATIIATPPYIFAWCEEPVEVLDISASSY
jgi:hypothetical protein